MGNGIDEAESKEGLTVTPQSIDFGSLTQGQGATAKLEVLGGPGSVTALSDYLKVSPGSFTSDSSDIEVRLLGGSEGELVWDDIVLKTDSQEIRVSVTARWELPELERTVDMGTRTAITQPAETTTPLKVDVERTFKGRACSRCGRNFAYDTGSMSWEQCTCSWYEVIWNIGVRIYRDLRYGARELPSYVQEIWRIIIGKEKW